MNVGNLVLNANKLVSNFEHCFKNLKKDKKTNSTYSRFNIILKSFFCIVALPVKEQAFWKFNV